LTLQEIQSPDLKAWENSDEFVIIQRNISEPVFSELKFEYSEKGKVQVGDKVPYKVSIDLDLYSDHDLIRKLEVLGNRKFYFVKDGVIRGGVYSAENAPNATPQRKRSKKSGKITFDFEFHVRPQNIPLPNMPFHCVM
jgi:hypothetical protein